MGFFSTSTVLSVFLAVILGFEVAPRLALASRTAALAMRFAAVSLALDAGWLFFHLPLQALARLPLGDFLLREGGRLFFTAFWACLAWSALAFVSQSPAKPGGPELR
jgi:hypothetical protein